LHSILGSDQWYVGFVKAVKTSEHFYSMLYFKWYTFLYGCNLLVSGLKLPVAAD